MSSPDGRPLLEASSRSAALRISDDDLEKLQQKRIKKGLCPKCGVTQTHKKHMMRMIPENIHGLVYQGICLRCNPPPDMADIKVSYGGLGWERAVRLDQKFRWQRSFESGSLKPSSRLDCAFVRKVEFLGGDDEGMCTGRVTLVPIEGSVVNSTVACSAGRTIVNFSDIEKAQKLSLKDKVVWFQETCATFCGIQRDHARITVRQKHILDDSIKAVMSFSRADLRKPFLFERERELGPLSPKEWYASVIGEVFSPDAGLWQKCAMDETRVEINTISDTLCPDHLKYFRFVGRILATALIDQQLVRCRLAKHIYKILLGWPIVLDDLKDLDLGCHSFLTSLENGAGVEQLDLNFTAPKDIFPPPMTTRVPLVPNGFDIAVDQENLPGYVEACFKHRMFGQCNDQLSELVLGFYDVLPEPLLAIFDFQELEELLVGSFTGGKTEEDEASDTSAESSRPIPTPRLAEIADEPAHVPRDHSLGAEEKILEKTGGEDRPSQPPQPQGQHVERNVSPLSSIPSVPNSETSGAQSDSGDIVTGTGAQGESLVEATVVSDEPEVYEAVRVDSSSTLGADERNRRIRLGQCPKCGIQTQKVSGIFNKKYRPLSNEHVLSGRCLLCNPVERASTQTNVLNSSSSNAESAEAENYELRDVLRRVEGSTDEITASDNGTIENLTGDNSIHERDHEKETKLDGSNDLQLNLTETGVEHSPQLATTFTTTDTSIAAIAVTCKHCYNDLFMPEGETAFICEKCKKISYLEECHRLRALGDEAFLDRDLSEAIRLYVKAVEQKPSDHQSLSNLSTAYLRKGDANSAVNALECATAILGIKPNCQRGYYNRGAALCLLQRDSHSILAFEDGLAKYPHDPALLYALGQNEDEDNRHPDSSRGNEATAAGSAAVNDAAPSIPMQPSNIFEEGAYRIPARYPFRLVIVRGSIVNFVYPSNPQKSAIVNCANEAGINDAICEAGGPSLWEDRQSLLFGPVSSAGVAFVTGPSDTYGRLNVPYVIHGFNPIYTLNEDLSVSDSLLSSTYTSGLNCAKGEKIEAIAFSLLSANSRGRRNLDEVLRIGIESICTFEGYPELKEVYLFASTRSKAETLVKLAIQTGLSLDIVGKPNQAPGDMEITPTLATSVFTNNEAANSAGGDLSTNDGHASSFEESKEEISIPRRQDTSHEHSQVESSEEQLSPDPEIIDENLDILGQLVNLAAARSGLHYSPSASGSNVLPCDVHLKNPMINPSGLTLDSYFRHADRFSDVMEPSVSLSENDAQTSNTEVNEFDALRLYLNSVVECIEAGPVQLPQKYVEMIKTDTVIGGGYFGEVRLGIDMTTGKRFAIKLIKPLVIEQALASQLQSIQKSFQNEINILSQIRHPNIASLYGYCMEEAGLQNTCLLYEFATNGSLDKFLKNENNNHKLERSRLSEAKTRARIALEVATVLRYMHEGLDGGAKCYHRDIKSANICLTADFSARVVDCGLAKYVTEEPGTFTSAGPTGTPGYTCPQYLQGEISFRSACDVFSLGVVICELVTGKLSCRKAQHYSTYKKKSKSEEKLIKDADDCVDWGDKSCLRKMALLALKCLRFSSKRRPSIGCVVTELRDIVNENDDPSDNWAVDLSSRERAAPEDDGDSLDLEVSNNQGKCQFCGEVANEWIRCSGGSQSHLHCHNCVQSGLQRNMNKFRYGGLACLRDGCDSRRFEDDEVASLVSSDVWSAYTNQRNSHLFQSMGKSMLNRVEANFYQMQRLLVQLSAGNGLPCPRLFILVEADREGKKIWNSPVEWAKNAGTVKWIRDSLTL